MSEPDSLESYRFNWEIFSVMASGTSAIDAQSFLAGCKTSDEASDFLDGYGFDADDPIQSAELFGNYQEALQFIRRYFLKEGNSEGLAESIPSIYYSITDISELLLIATGHSKRAITDEEAIWASIILKVMHTILHLDKDLRHRFYSTIQTQIFDRFYKYVQREDEELFLVSDDRKVKIPILEFETKSKKTRESTIIKLLHKKENVAEELFDRIGLRFITKSKIDSLRVLKFLYKNNIVMPNNIKPSRSQNSLINLSKFELEHDKLLNSFSKKKISEEDFYTKVEAIAEKCSYEDVKNENRHTSSSYKAIHFTSRQLIKYKNPFYQAFSEVRDFAKSATEESELADKIIDLDTSSIAKDVRFFYPFEVQVADIESHKMNTEGDASHDEYKKSQLSSAQGRLFSSLIEFKKSQKD